VTEWDESAAELWEALQGLMQSTAEGVDFTVLHRQLGSFDTPADGDANVILSALEPCFYTELGDESRAAWSGWCEQYLARLEADARDSTERRAEQNAASPKFVPRNWMLTTAYEAAEEGASWTSDLACHSASIYLGMTSLTRGPRGSLPGDYSVIEELQALFRTPYEEHSDALSRKYFRRTPAWWVPNC